MMEIQNKNSKIFVIWPRLDMPPAVQSFTP